MSSSSDTTEARPFFDPTLWKRRGRGKELQFFALDKEVEEWLATSLPQEFAPFDFLTVRMVPVGKRQYREAVAFIHGPDFARSLRALPEESRTLWISSRRLTPEPDALSTSAACATNGLIALDHGGVRAGAQGESRIAIVNEVENVSTGERVVHEDYSAVFASLAKVIRRELKFGTIIEGRGPPIEDTRVARMTTAAAVAASKGEVKFTRLPLRGPSP